MPFSSAVPSVHRKSRTKFVYEEKPCSCGCGHTFIADMANRSRKFARDCPFQKDRKVAYGRVQLERQRLARLGQVDPSLSRPGAVAPHRKVKVCRVCGNLPERRPLCGCPRCKFPAGPPAPIVVTHQAEGYDVF